MTATLQLALTLSVRDPASASAVEQSAVKDASATAHEYLDLTPRNVGTPGQAGVSFVRLETSVVQIERVVADVPAGADLIARFGGDVARLLGASAAPSFTGGETLQLAADDGATVTTTFQAGDSTMALVARRINYAHGQPLADVDVLGRLRLQGQRTGGADAFAKARQFGRLWVVGGTALAPLGLVTGVTYGQGDDQDVGPGLFIKTFPSRALPRSLELSGAAQGARFWLAGKAA